MDIISHALWTNAIYLKARRHARWWAIGFALLPDALTFGPFFIEELAVHGIHPVRSRSRSHRPAY